MREKGRVMDLLKERIHFETQSRVGIYEIIHERENATVLKSLKKENARLLAPILGKNTARFLRFFYANYPGIYTFQSES